MSFMSVRSLIIKMLIDKLFEALELILINTYIQFNGSIFKEIPGIPMGGNTSPFIADLSLSWCE